MRSPYAPSQPEDQDHHRSTCRNCGAKIKASRTGRKREFCSERCRDTHRRQSNFEFCGSTRYPTQAKPRNAKNTTAISNGCKADFAGRGSAINGLRRRIIDVEVIAPHEWTEVTSADGVVSYVAILQPRSLRGAP